MTTEEEKQETRVIIFIIIVIFVVIGGMALLALGIARADERARRATPAAAVRVTAVPVIISSPTPTISLTPLSETPITGLDVITKPLSIDILDVSVDLTAESGQILASYQVNDQFGFNSIDNDGVNVLLEDTKIKSANGDLLLIESDEFVMLGSSNFPVLATGQLEANFANVADEKEIFVESNLIVENIVWEDELEFNPEFMDEGGYFWFQNSIPFDTKGLYFSGSQWDQETEDGSLHLRIEISNSPFGHDLEFTCFRFEVEGADNSRNQCDGPTVTHVYLDEIPTEPIHFKIISSHRYKSPIEWRWSSE